MTYLIADGVFKSDKHYAQIEKIEPELVLSPWLSAMLTTGRSYFDRPDECTILEGEYVKNLPKKIFISNYPKVGVPDVLGIGHGWIVSQRVKEKLDELEAGAHSFFPVDVIDNDTNNKIIDAYIIYIHQKPNIIDHEKTLYANEFGCESQFGVDSARKSNFDFATLSLTREGMSGFSRSIINFTGGKTGNRHLWRGTVGKEDYFETDVSELYDNQTAYLDPLSDQLFVSDEFAKFLLTENITGWIPVKIFEETPEWYAEQLSQGVLS